MNILKEGYNNSNSKTKVKRIILFGIVVIVLVIFTTIFLLTTQHIYIEKDFKSNEFGYSISFDKNVYTFTNKSDVQTGKYKIKGNKITTYKSDNSINKIFIYNKGILLDTSSAMDNKIPKDDRFEGKYSTIITNNVKYTLIFYSSGKIEDGLTGVDGGFQMRKSGSYERDENYVNCKIKNEIIKYYVYKDILYTLFYE